MKRCLIVISCLVLLTGCTANSKSLDSTASYSSGNLLDRLNSANEVKWLEDVSRDLTGSQNIGVYIGDNCAVWVFQNLNRVRTLIDQDFFSWYEGSSWYGEDGKTSYGIVLLTQDKESSCAKSATIALNWQQLEDSSEVSAPSDSSDSTDNYENYDDSSLLPDGNSGSAAYEYGYEASMGASAALIEEFGGVDQYCDSLLLLHPEFDDQEKADYLLGCVDANS